MSEYVLKSGEAGEGQFDLAISPERANWTYSGLNVATLSEGESVTFDTGEFEYLVLPLEGSFDVESGDFTAELEGRGTIWGEVTDYAFVPRGSSVTVTATSDGRVALPYALADDDPKPRYCPADEAEMMLRGAGNCSRQVTNYSINNPVETSRLLVCEVITPGGNWSSYPAHKHDENSDVERELEEIYYFQIHGNEHGPGLAFHATYGTDERPIDVAAIIHDGDAALVPHGWHGPCVAAPGYDLYYLNVMAGPGGPEWKSVDDPTLAWIRDTWDGEDVDPRLPLSVEK